MEPHNLSKIFAYIQSGTTAIPTTTPKPSKAPTTLPPTTDNPDPPTNGMRYHIFTSPS